MKDLVELAALSKFADDNFDTFEDRMINTEGWTHETTQSFLHDYQREIAARVAELEAYEESD